MIDEDAGDVAEVEVQPATSVRWFGVVLLVGHIALLAVGALALWSIAGGGGVGALAAAVFVVGYAAMWRFLLAPGSRSRLGYRERLTVSLIVGPIVVLLGSLSGLWLLGLVATSIVLLGDALNES